MNDGQRALHEPHGVRGAVWGEESVRCILQELSISPQTLHLQHLRITVT
jgi:hypothetical protein